MLAVVCPYGLRMDELTAFQRDVLWTIAGAGGASGLDLMALLEDVREGTVHHSRVYQNLTDLAEADYVDVREVNGRRNEYTLSEHARARLQERVEWEAHQLDQRVVSLQAPEVEA